MLYIQKDIHKNLPAFIMKGGAFDRLLAEVIEFAHRYRWDDIVIAPRQGRNDLDLEIYFCREKAVGYGFIGRWDMWNAPRRYSLTEWESPVFHQADAIANGLVVPKTLDEACSI